jgi:hypothetical protein
MALTTEDKQENRLAWGVIYFVLALLAAGCIGSCAFAFWLAMRMGS